MKANASDIQQKIDWFFFFCLYIRVQSGNIQKNHKERFRTDLHHGIKWTESAQNVYHQSADNRERYLRHRESAETAGKR